MPNTTAEKELFLQLWEREFATTLKEQFNNSTCPFLNFSRSRIVKPETLSVPNLTAGTYTLYVGNRGPTQESIGFQITLTTVPAEATVLTPTTSFGGSKGSYRGIVMPF